MKLKHFTLSRLAAVAALALLPLTQQQSLAVSESLRLEAQASIKRGVDFLLEGQMDNGSWHNQPSMTGLACIALHGSGFMESREDVRQAVEKGREFILTMVQPSGAIAPDDKSYLNYSTAISLSTLATINHPDDVQIMRNARRFLIGIQLDEDHPEHPTQPDNPYYGGIGYGSAGPTRPDLSNTQLALEALHLTEHLDRDTEFAEESRLAWKKATQFLEQVQNVPKDTDQSWVVSDRDDPNRDGGFFYKPSESKATEKLKKQGQDVEALRSYASMTYAGLKSMIYADLDRDDYRVRAALDWARNNYDLSENPGMGPEGHYYYLQTFAKALNAWGQNTITLTDDTEREWREDLIRTLLKLQKPEGQWYNEKHGRWMESIPELATSYSLIAMQIALGETN